MNRLTDIFKVLADETRVRMLLVLFQNELCVCELSKILDAPQSRISRNLSKLRDMNYVDFERREKFIFYFLRLDNKILISIINDILDNITDYPKLLDDQNKLKDVGKVLTTCKY